MANNNSNNNSDNKKKKIIISVISIILVIIILLLLLRSCSTDSDLPGKDFNISSEEENWNGEQNKPAAMQQEYMEVPYYGTLWISEEDPYVWFNNPETNNVYFSYEVLLDGEELFHNDEYISPGKALKANLYQVLEKGEYDIVINISAIDENGSPCNGATQDAKIIVQ